MEREFLEDCLARGMSLKGIAKNAGCAPGTVGYWVRKHGLMAHGSAKFDPTRSPDPVAVTALAERGHSLKRIADELGTSPRAVSRCMRKLGITGMRSRRAATVRQARAEGRRSAMLDCPKHGHTEFWIGEKVIRCRRCNATGVANRRRKLKEILVEEAGGSCRLCGYDRSPAALEFRLAPFPFRDIPDEADKTVLAFDKRW